jgi:16S rRNA (guanine527-N7)-methyltransferase
MNSRHRAASSRERGRPARSLSTGVSAKSGRDAREPGDLSADRERALAMFDLSSETVARLDLFVDLLLTWQRRTNLVAPSTIPSLWTRHIADSLQLLDVAKVGPAGAASATPRIWLDLGSGGGFPGVVLACALADVPGAQVHLVDSNLKKAAFLREAIRETKTPGVVHAIRIDELAPALDAISVDCVTARALAPLPDLLEMIAPFVKRGAKALLLKGQDLDHELTESTKHWHIETDSVPSKTDKSGRILIVHTLSKRFNLSLADSGERDGAESPGSGRRLKP